MDSGGKSPTTGRCFDAAGTTTRHRHRNASHVECHHPASQHRFHPAGNPQFSASGGIQQAGAHQEPGRVRPHLRTRRKPIPEAFWARHRRASCTGSSRGQGAGVECAVGEVVCRRHRSIFPTTVSTATCRPGARTRPPSSGKANRARVRTLTYQQLLAEVQKFANVLKSLGIKKGDRVAIYMGMVSGAADRDAGLRAHRRRALGDLRRLLRQRAGRSHHRSASRGRHHAGRFVPPRQRSEAEGHGGRSAATSVPVGEACHRLQAHRPRQSP